MILLLSFDQIYYCSSSSWKPSSQQPAPTPNAWWRSWWRLPARTSAARSASSSPLATGIMGRHSTLRSASVVLFMMTWSTSWSRPRSPLGMELMTMPRSDWARAGEMCHARLRLLPAACSRPWQRTRPRRICSWCPNSLCLLFVLLEMKCWLSSIYGFVLGLVWTMKLFNPIAYIFQETKTWQELQPYNTMKVL